MTKTTISLDKEIRDPLREKKGFDQSWNEFMEEVLQKLEDHEE